MTDFAIIYLGLTLVLLILIWLVALLFRRNAILEFRLMQMELIFAEFETHRLEHKLKIEKNTEMRALFQETFLEKVDEYSEKMETIIRNK